MQFNEIPSPVRVPFTFVEFDNTGAVTGPSSKAYKALLIGPKLASGTAVEFQQYSITTDEQGEELFGVGSILSQMVKSWRKNNNFMELKAISVVDLLAGVAATGSIKINGTATKAGVLNCYIAGVAVKVAVASGDTPATIATSLIAKIAALTSLPVTSAVDGVDTSKVNITFKHKGEVGNYTDIRFNYYEGEVLPDGLTAPTVVNLASGAGNPDLEALIAAIPETSYEAIVCPYTDGANLTLLSEEMVNRWGPVLQATGIVYTAKTGSFGDLETFGDSKNDKALVVFECHAMPSPVWAVAAAMTAVTMNSISKDQARPLQTLEVLGILPAAKKDLFKFEERNLLLFDGIATHVTDEFNKIKLERVITTYKKNGAGADDVSYLDVETIYTLDYMRYDFKNTIALKYPRHKLCGDDVKVVPPNTITPMTAKAEAVTIYKSWIALGLAENLEAFIAGLIVERNISDVNRLDWLLTPDLMNQLKINGVQIKYIL
jgi:phage tail sheath gpL-like